MLVFCIYERKVWEHMADIRIYKRVKVYQYQFEIASVDGKRKYINKSGFKTRAEDNLNRMNAKIFTIQKENGSFVNNIEKINKRIKTII